MWRPVGSGAEVANEDQINRMRRPVRMTRLTGTLFPVPHLTRSPVRG